MAKPKYLPRTFKITNMSTYRSKVVMLTKTKIDKYGELYFGKDFRTLKTTNSLTIDHVYSIADGFKNKIDPHIIAGVYNLRLIPKTKNIQKGSDSHLTKEELFKKHNDFIEWVENKHKKHLDRMALKSSLDNIMKGTREDYIRKLPKLRVPVYIPTPLELINKHYEEIV